MEIPAAEHERKRKEFLVSWPFAPHLLRLLEEQVLIAAYLKQTFSSGRSKVGAGGTAPFVPPVALPIDRPHGAHLLALGRRKWRSQGGGYPTLTHGGLSLLKELSSFVELSKSVAACVLYGALANGTS